MFRENRDDMLSPEERVNSMFDAASKEIETLDHLISKLHDSKKPSLDLRPPGMTGGRTSSDREKHTEFYKSEQERIKADAKARTSKVIENVSPSLKLKLSLQIDKWQNPDFKEKSEEKDLSQSQDYALRLKGRSALRKELEAKSGITPSNPAKKEDAKPSMPAWLVTPKLSVSRKSKHRTSKRSKTAGNRAQT